MAAGVQAIKGTSDAIVLGDGGCVSKWRVRAYMTELMTEASMERLPLGRISVNGLVRMNPDQCGHMVRIRNSFAHLRPEIQDPKAFITAIGGSWFRAEWLSMHFCFAGDDGFVEEDFADFDAARWCQAFEI